MAKKPASQGAKKLPDQKSTLAKAKTAVVHAVEKVADVASDIAHAAQDHVVTPVAEAVGLKKKAPVRSITKSPNKPLVLPAPSKKPAGKMMSKGIAPPLKKAPTRGVKTKGKAKP